MTYSYKERPCPGCDEVEKRPPQTLCKTCQRRLEVGRKREAEIDNLKTSGEKIQVALDTRFHYGSGAHVSFLSIKDYDVLNALVRLGRLEKSGGTYTGARRIHYESSFSGGYRSRPRHHIFATQQQADDIELVLDYIKEIVIKAYADGHRDGRSLIRQLATVGMEELNQITTGVGNA